MSAMDDLRKAANELARERIEQFLQEFSAETLAVMLVDYETGHDAPTKDYRYMQIMDAGFEKVGGQEFIEMTEELRAAEATISANLAAYVEAQS